ncbi:MAG: hypothetical protein ACK553_04940 [Planctomycetota bacterium]|jgi:hypothetical protein
MSLRTLPLFAAWFVFAVYSVDAQDPFSDFGDAPDGVEDRINTPQRGAGTADAGVDVRERDAVVLSLRREPPTDAVGIAKAAQWMARIRRWDEAGRWLDQLGSGDMPPGTALEIVEAIGSKTLLDIENQFEGLSDQQRATAAKIRNLASQATQNPASLMSRVAQLRSNSRGERVSAFEALKAGGNSGITAMLHSVMAEGAESPNSSMVEAFSLLGEHATRAWQAAMTTPHADARQRLVALVAGAPKPKMGCELMMELYDPALDDSMRAGLARAVAGRDAAPPAAETVNEYASQLVEHSIIDYQRRTRLNEVDTEVAWVLQPDGRTLAEIPAVPAHLALARASQAAQLALRLSPHSNIASATALAAHWEHLALTGSSDTTRDEVFQKIIPESLRDSHEFACLVWDAAVKSRLSGAQALAISNLSRWEGAGIPVPVRDRLVAATRSGVPMIRYPATQSLMKSIQEINAQPKTDETAPAPQPLARAGFLGSSRIDAVGREMQQLSYEPIALIVGGHEGLRGHLHGLLDQLGYRYFEAASAAEVFALLRSGLPIEGVFIVHHVRELDLGQLVQRIRANPTTSTVPIAMLADSLSRGEHSVAEEDHRVVVGSVPPSVEGLGDIVARMRSVTDPPLLAPESRILFKDSADNYFQSVRSSPSELASRSAGNLMAASRDEQNLLLRIASDSTESEAKREQASRNFVQSVRRFGLLITSEMAQDQYDVYNLRGESEPVTRAVMGRILDAIEAGDGKRPWAEVSP